MESIVAIRIRSLIHHVPPVIGAAFASSGSVKSEAQYRLYQEQEAAGSRISMAAAVEEKIAGFVTIDRSIAYPGFTVLKIPEIQDLNVLPAYRRLGIATRPVLCCGSTDRSTFFRRWDWS